MGVFWLVHLTAPDMKAEHSWHTPFASRKYVSAHWVQLMKLFEATQLLQPVEPWYVVSVQSTQRFETRMPDEQAVQVDPSLQPEQ